MYGLPSSRQGTIAADARQCHQAQSTKRVPSVSGIAPLGLAMLGAFECEKSSRRTRR